MKPFEYLEKKPAKNAPISDNPSGLYCPSCRSIGISHCSSPEYCGEMRLMKTLKKDNSMKKKIALLLIISLCCIIVSVVSEYYKINSHSYWIMFGSLFSILFWETLRSMGNTK